MIRIYKDWRGGLPIFVEGYDSVPVHILEDMLPLLRVYCSTRVEDGKGILSFETEGNTKMKEILSEFIKLI